jgi:hypothetical protein
MKIWEHALRPGDHAPEVLLNRAILATEVKPRAVNKKCHPKCHRLCAAETILGRPKKVSS